MSDSRVRLPSPEEYGKKLAQQRWEASGMPRVLAMLAALLEKMDESRGDSQDTREALQAGLASFEQKLKTMLGALPDDSEALARFEGHMQRLGDELAAVKTDLSRQMERMTQMSASSADQNREVDLSRIEALADRLEARASIPQPVMAPAVPITPSALSLRVLSRDENGDIQDVDVEVVRH